MIFHLNKETEEGHFRCFNLILEKSQIQEFLDVIKWVIPQDDYIDTKNDILSKREIIGIVRKNNNFDFLRNYEIEVENASVTGFLLRDFIRNKTILPQKGVAFNLFNQITPIKNRPSFKSIYGKCLWLQELGLFQIIEGNKGFYNPVSKCLCFKNYDDYNKYLEEINCLKTVEKKVKKMEDKTFVRVISVYEKTTKELKYRILNEEFNYNSFAFYNLKPFEEDEGIFFRSYKITKSLAKKYADWTSLIINYDFQNNDYYFETLEASRFYYSQQELLDNLK